MRKDEMDRITKGLATKSAKIRALNKLGVSRSEIANYLQIRYQHVRNVLLAPAPRSADDHDHAGSSSAPNSDDTAPQVRPLSIDEAKLGLAAHFGVAPSKIEITIRG